MRKAPSALLACLALTAGACGKPTSEPTFDFSTDAAIQKSFKEVRASLPEERQGEYDEAMEELLLASFNMHDLKTGANLDGHLKRLEARLRGLNAEEVIAAGEELRAHRDRDAE